MNDDILKKYEMSPSDIPLLEYNNIFVGNLAFIHRGIVKDIATYDLVVREISKPWSFLTMNGLERLVHLILNYRFDDEAISIMKAIGIIDSSVSEDFYINFKFTGNVLAMKDGTIFFPGEPIVRITAPLGQANLFTAFIMNVLAYPIRIMTKNARIKIALGDKSFMGGTVVRLPGFEQGLWNIRDAFILGSMPYTPIFYKKFSQYKPSGKISANINHAFIKSFSSEREAFHFFFNKMLPKCFHAYVMVDTYEIKRGLRVFIEEAKKVKGFGETKVFITLDSGNTKKLAHWARKELDKAGFKNVGIQVMGNHDEYSVAKLVKSKTPIDMFFLRYRCR